MKLVLAFSVVFCACVISNADARIREPVHGGSACVNACKEPWRYCFRQACFSIPGYKNAPAAKREQAEKIAQKQCMTEWSAFQVCKRSCDKSSALGLPFKVAAADYCSAMIPPTQ